MEKRLRAIRGAISVDRDEAGLIVEAARELTGTMLEENEANVDDVVSIIFTSTDDLSSEFPAVGAREAGLWSIPLLCAREIPVPGSQPRCIRALAHAYLASDLEVRHVYLRDASALRPDLAFTSHDGTIPHER